MCCLAGGRDYTAVIQAAKLHNLDPDFKPKITELNIYIRFVACLRYLDVYHFTMCALT